MLSYRGGRRPARWSATLCAAVGGIIGIRKFIYDFWGDTVNTASRLESHGVPGSIQVTAETAARLSSSYVCEPRGEVHLKGKGPVDVFFLTARKA